MSICGQTNVGILCKKVSVIAQVKGSSNISVLHPYLPSPLFAYRKWEKKLGETLQAKTFFPHVQVLGYLLLGHLNFQFGTKKILIFTISCLSIELIECLFIEFYEVINQSTIFSK